MKTVIQQRPISRPFLSLFVVLVLGTVSSCTQSALLNAWAPAADFAIGTGQQTPRAIQVGFINNTPYRAIFTFGAYDQTDKDSLPTGFGQLRLEGSTSNDQVAQPCRKTFSVGGDELIRLISENRDNPSISAGITNVSEFERALVRGIYFSNAPLGDPLQDEPTEGTAEGLVLLDGVDFSCRRTDIRETTGTGLLLVTFEEDAASPGGFRVDYSFVTP